MFQIRLFSISRGFASAQSECFSRAKGLFDELCCITISLERTGLGALGCFIRFLVVERRSVPVAQFVR